ncbi:MAG: PA14 domain-containing protein [Anaerolineales bacterium]|nr:PA14 domain-containing protein [Anaerolineales bacterium]
MKRIFWFLGLATLVGLIASATGATSISAAPTAQQSSAWTGFYFNNMYLQGNPVFTRDDPYIDFNWGYWGPGGGIPGTNFSVRWLRWLYMDRAGNWTFLTITDDGVRVWVDNQLIIDAWYDQPPTQHTATRHLTQGYHLVQMEYYQHLVNAEAHFQVRYGAPTPPQPQPQPGPQPFDLAIDTRSPYFSKGGDAFGWNAFANGYYGIAYWTYNNAYTRYLYNWARWHLPPTRACHYEVSVYLPQRVATTRHARYSIAHNGRYESRSVNQSAYTNQWVSLGTFDFHGRGGEYVSLTDVTGEPFLSTLVVFDSVNFAPRCTMWGW